MNKSTVHSPLIYCYSLGSVSAQLEPISATDNVLCLFVIHTHSCTCSFTEVFLKCPILRRICELFSNG